MKSRMSGDNGVSAAQKWMRNKELINAITATHDRKECIEKEIIIVY
jgi:hypothetical protein